MHPAFEIESQVRSYLERQSTLEELRDWYQAARPVLLALPPETRASDIATLVELSLIEHRRGDFSERQLRTALKRILGTTVSVTIEEGPSLAMSTGVTTQLSPVTSEPDLQVVILSSQLTPTGTSS